jgi:O-antigen ligase
LRKRRFALGLLLVGGVLVYGLGPESGRDRVHSMFDPGHAHNVERIETWKYGGRLVLQRPLTGAGLVIPRHLMEEGTFVTDEGVTLVPHSHMHMAYLQIAVAMGIPGLAVFVWLVIGLFRLSRGAARAPLRNLWEEGLVAAFPAVLVALLVNGLFEWNFGDSEVLGLLYFLVGGVLGIERGSEV